MATTPMNSVLPHLRRAALRADGDGPTDGLLLEAFLARRDEAAFAALLRRHGRMVLGVCRRVLGNRHDAEDAFQATFLVLARKAATVEPRERVGNWLYGVAYRTALDARAADYRRRKRERPLEHMPEPVAAPQETWPELRFLLDQELSRLPDKYRTPVVLCELEGRTRKEVARQLAIPEGTLSSRLAAARRLLAARLTRRGVVLSGGALAVLLARNAASAAVPPALATSTVKAATLLAAGKTAAGLVSAEAAALAKGVIQSMFLSKLKLGAATLLAAGLVTFGAGALTYGALADQTTKPPAGAPREGQAGGAEQKKADAAKDGARPKEQGAGDKGKAGGREKVTLTGKVEKKDVERTRDDGTTFTATVYYLAEKDGNKVQLPAPRRNDAGQLLDDYDLAEFIDKEVVVTGQAVLARKSEKVDAARQATRLLVISEIKLKK